MIVPSVWPRIVIGLVLDLENETRGDCVIKPMKVISLPISAGLVERTMVPVSVSE